MKTEFKLLIRSLSSYVMIFTGVSILLWFVFVVITSVFGLRYYAGDIMEMMIFLLIMGIVVISMASVINISLSIDLIAEAKMKELKFTDPYAAFGRSMLKWGFVCMALLMVSVFVGDYVIHRSKVQENKSLTARVVESHLGNLEKIPGYLQDTAQIHKITEVLKTISNSSDQVSTTEVILVEEVFGKESLIAISKISDSDYLVNRQFENLVIVPSVEEKTLIQSLLSGKLVGAQVLELEEGAIRGYYPISKDGKTIIIRIIPQVNYSGSRR